jgi:hypothetical protein
MAKELDVLDIVVVKIDLADPFKSLFEIILLGLRHIFSIIQFVLNVLVLYEQNFDLLKADAVKDVHIVHFLEFIPDHCFF